LVRQPITIFRTFDQLPRFNVSSVGFFGCTNQRAPFAGSPTRFRPSQMTGAVGQVHSTNR
jgi:hypothetical protein